MGVEIGAFPPDVSDADRLRERLDDYQESVRGGVTAGRVEIASIEPPEWVTQARDLIAAVGDEAISDPLLADVAKELGYDLDKILGREDEDQEPDMGFSGLVGRQERGKG